MDDISVIKKGNHIRLKHCLHEKYLAIKGNFEMIFSIFFVVRFFTDYDKY